MWYNRVMQKLPKTRISEVKPDVNWGLYMWKLPDGKLFKDADGNYLNIPSRKYDMEKIASIRQAAAYYGQPDGTPHFEPGLNRATDEERAEQEDMLRHGEMLPNDIGAMVDELRGRMHRGDDGE